MLKLIPTPQFAEISETKTLKQILFHTAKKYLDFRFCYDII